MPKAKKQALTQEERLAQALVPESEQPYVVPGNWVWVTLEKAGVESQYGYTEKSSVEEIGPRFLRITDIQDECVDWSLVPYCKIGEDDFPKYMLSVGDIVVARTGATTGKSYMIRDDIEAVFASYLIRLTISNKLIINPYYLYTFMQGPLYWNQMIEVSSGIAQPGANANKLKKLVIPLPPVAEQHRIVTRIESLFNKLDRAKELAQAALDSFETRKAAILHKAFTRELTAKWRETNGVGLESWEKCSLQSVCTMKITDGTHQTPTYCDQDRGVPFISAKDVTSGEINWTKIKYITPELHEELYKRVAPQRDDVLLAKNGTTGVAAIVDTDKIFDIYVTLAILRPDKNIILPRFLLSVINSPVCKAQFNENLTGIGVPNLHLRDIREVEIPLPGITEQTEIVRILDSLLEKEQQARQLTDIIEKIDHMKKAILARAFRGELGTNDPSEESAIELLSETF